MANIARILTALALLLALSAGLSAQGKDKGKPFPPNREWSGIVGDDKLAKERPADGLITDAKSLEKLWKAWGVEKKVPAVDFAKEFVLVTTALGGPDRPRVRATLDEAGNLKVSAISTLIGGPGFGYALGIYPRAGVKTVDGKALR